ncbi:MAG: cation-transporting P-type ATPase [Pirellulaceae bacterium]|nr:cation-transporting P-type ATPase [Pirellulaceae bacterium]
MMKNGQNDAFTSDATISPAPQSAGVQAWHVLSFEAVKDRLKVDVSRGLSQSESAQRRAPFGPNVLGRRGFQPV